MRTILGAAGVTVALLTAACTASPPAPPPYEPVVDWTPSRVGVAPSGDPSQRVRTVEARPPLGKFSLRFYERLRARPVVAPLGAVDVWELRHHPRQVDIVTVGAVPVRQWSGRAELLDHLATTDGLTRDKAEVLVNWVRSGGVLWVEFGVFLQGHEWVRGGPRRLPPLPDLAGFTILGLPTQTAVFEAKRTGAFTIEPVVVTTTNQAQHPATADVRTLKLVQADLRTVYAVIRTEQAEVLVREGDRVYASAVSLGRGRIVTTLPFDPWDAESDGEKYRINLREWLAGHPVPVFDPRLDVDRSRD